MAEELDLQPAPEPTPPPAVEAPAPAEKAATEPSEKPKKQSTRETIKAAIKEETEKADRLRDEAGKFVKADKAAPKEAAAKPESQAPKSEQAKLETKPSSAIEPPAGWSKEAKALWSSLPPSVQSDAVRREQEAAKGIEEYRSKLKNFEPIGQVVEKHTPVFQQLGVAPQQFLENAISWHQALANPQTRVAAFREFAQSFGLDPSTLAPQSSAEPQAAIPPQLQPIVQQFPQITQEINQLRSQISGFQNERVSSEIEAFKKDHPHFEKVRTSMGQLMQSGAVTTLEEAYQKAIWLDDSIRKEMNDAELEKRTKEAQERAAKAHKAAVSTPSRAPVGNANGANAGKKGVRASIMAAIEETREKQRA